MKLLIDAGNTRIKWAIVNDMTRRAQASGETASHSTKPSKDAGQVAGYGAGMSFPRLLPQSAGYASNVSEADNSEWLRRGVLPVEQAGHLSQQFADVYDIQEIWVSNVAGEKVAQRIRNIKVDQSASFNFIVAREMQCGVRNGYANPGQLGSDRWAALIAAWHLVRGKCMVVNCGTAITIDTLSEQGKFIGGLILPGVELMRRSLVAATNQLRPEQGSYTKFPLNTADALFSGTIQACCGAIERQYALLDDDSAPVVLSGGAAGILHKRLKLPLQVVDNLVLQGLLLIAQESGA